MSISNESEAKITKAVEEILSVLRRVGTEFTEDEGILFTFRLQRAMEKEGFV